MKTKEEIEQLAQEIHYGYQNKGLNADGCFNQYQGYIKGYTQCQEDMVDKSIEFAEWIRIKDFQTASMNRWIGLNMKYYTTKELFEQFINSLNKQD